MQSGISIQGGASDRVGVKGGVCMDRSTVQCRWCLTDEAVRFRLDCAHSGLVKGVEMSQARRRGEREKGNSRSHWCMGGVSLSQVESSPAC